MPTAEILPAPTARRQRRFTVEEYHRLGEAGILGPKDRCELIHGRIVEKPVVNPPHATAIQRLQKKLTAVFGIDALIRIQLPITLSDSEPEPDVVYANGAIDDYATRHPGPGDCLIVIEVGDSTILEDQTVMLELYAAEKVSQYWIVNLPDRRIEVYSRPRGGKSPRYLAHTNYPAGSTVPVIVAGRELGSIAVSEILP